MSFALAGLLAVVAIIFGGGFYYVRHSYDAALKIDGPFNFIVNYAVAGVTSEYVRTTP